MALYTVEKITMDHRSGSKQYHLLLLLNHDIGKALLVNRWGKSGAWGQMKVEVGDTATLIKSFNSKIDEKEGRGYRTGARTVQPCDSHGDLQREIGVAYWPQLGESNLTSVFPGIVAAGSREASPVNWKTTVDGKFVPDDTPKHSMPSPEEELAEKKANPKWGMF